MRRPNTLQASTPREMGVRGNAFARTDRGHTQAERHLVQAGVQAVSEDIAHLRHVRELSAGEQWLQERRTQGTAPGAAHSQGIAVQSGVCDRGGYARGGVVRLVGYD